MGSAQRRDCSIGVVDQIWSDPIEEEWDRFLSRVPLAHHEQSVAYGHSRVSFGHELERVVLKRDGQIVGGAQVLVRSTPLGSLAVVRRGPLAIGDCLQIYAEIIALLEESARTRGWFCIRVETFAPQVHARAALAEAGFFPTRSWQTQRRSVAMPLTDDHSMLAAMHSKGRYNVRRAIQRGVRVRIGDRSSIRTFHDLHMLTASHQKFPAFPLEYFEYLWDLLAESGRVQHFIACHNEQPVAAIFNSVVGDSMYYGWGGIDRDESKSRLMSNYLLHYEAMRWAREHGCMSYDLAGISDMRVAGVTQFKTRIAPGAISWPSSMVKFFGPFRSGKRLISDFAWQNRSMRRMVLRFGHRLGLRPTMPW